MGAKACLYTRGSCNRMKAASLRARRAPTNSPALRYGIRALPGDPASPPRRKPTPAFPAGEVGGVGGCCLTPISAACSPGPSLAPARAGQGSGRSRSAAAGRRQRSASSQGGDLPQRGHPAALTPAAPPPSPPPKRPRPSLPRTHTGHSSAGCGEESGAAGLADRPPGPGSAASGGGSEGKGRGTPRRGPAARITNKAAADWRAGGARPSLRRMAVSGRGAAARREGRQAGRLSAAPPVTATKGPGSSRQRHRWLQPAARDGSTLLKPSGTWPAVNTEGFLLGETAGARPCRQPR